MIKLFSIRLNSTNEKEQSKPKIEITQNEENKQKDKRHKPNLKPDIKENNNNLTENLIKTISEYEIMWAGLEQDNPMRAAYRQIISTLQQQLSALSQGKSSKEIVHKEHKQSDEISVIVTSFHS